MKSGRALLVLAMVIALPGAALSALSLQIDELDANAGLVFIGSNPPSTTPNLAIVPLIGISVPFRLWGPFFVEPGLDFLAWYYEWDSPSGSAVIIPSENGSGFFTIGALISLQAGVSFPVSSVISLGGALGLDFFLRFPLEFQNQVQAEESSALGWFFGNGRFFYPETRLFLRWHISEPVDLLLNLRAFYPVFHLWDGSGQPFWDSLMVSGGIGFAIRMRPAAPAK
jgi:hypothetical protein